MNKLLISMLSDPAIPDFTARLDKSAFVKACARNGAFTSDERAALVGRDRATIWRWASGESVPSLTDARAVAFWLDEDIDILWPRP